jgi:hypothetical protein
MHVSVHRIGWSLCWGVLLSFCVCPATRAASSGQAMAANRDLAAIICAIDPITRDAELRRGIAQATFCLPQNVLGVFFYALLELTGAVVNSARMNETTIVVTRAPVGVSLGRFIFLDESLLSEDVVRHEYGHTLQGYRHGPFYLLFEGAASFIQAAVSLVVPSFGRGYFSRWPENEADALGGVTQPAAGP